MSESRRSNLPESNDNSDRNLEWQFINFSTEQCLHDDEDLIHNDYRGGFAVCTNCGQVLDALYDYSDGVIWETDFNYVQYNFECMCYDHNLPLIVASEAFDRWNHHFPDLKANHFYYNAAKAFAFYEALLNLNIPYSLKEVGLMFGVNAKKIRKVEKTLAKYETLPLLPQDYVERFCIKLDIQFEHMKKIKKITKNVCNRFRYTKYLKPQGIVAVVLYYYAKCYGLDITLPDICIACDVSVSNTKRLLDDLYVEDFCDFFLSFPCNPVDSDENEE